MAGNRDGLMVPMPGFGIANDTPAGFIANLDLHVSRHVIAAGSPGYGFHNADSPVWIDMLNLMADYLAPTIQISLSVTREQLARDPAIPPILV